MNGRKYVLRYARENVPPAARKDGTEWERAHQRGYYLERADKREVWGGGVDVYGVGRLGSRARS